MTTVEVKRWWPAGLPLLLGLVAGLVLGPGLEVVVVVPLTNLLIGAGVFASLATAAVIAGLGLRRRSLGRAYADAQADRRRLLLRLDHELRNPLTAIRAGLANLNGESLARPERAALESVGAQTVRVVRLVADLRKLAELESSPIERVAVDPTDVLAEVEAVVTELPEAQARDLIFTVPQAPWPLPRVAGDRDLIFLAAHNLVTNALKFSAPGDRIEIRAFEEDERVVVEVADTGVGIPTDEVGHVWEELFRGRAAGGVAGTGLGLALVRTVVARHGGTVTLRSRHGQGTVVTMRLPTAG
jgi:two-component system, OmpR family, sensor kinase